MDHATERTNELEIAYALAKHAFGGSDIKIKRDIIEYGDGAIGSLTITGTIVSIINKDMFIHIVTSADTLELIPRTDGLIDIEFGFRNI